MFRTHPTNMPDSEEMTFSKDKLLRPAHNHRIHKHRSERKPLEQPLIRRSRRLKEMLILAGDVAVTEGGFDWKMENSLSVLV